MIETGQELRDNNEKIVRLMAILRRQRDEMSYLIEKQVTEKSRIENEIEKLSFKLILLTKSLGQRVHAKKNYDKTIREIEENYSNLVEESGRLLNNINKEVQDLEEIMDKRTGTSISEGRASGQSDKISRGSNQSDKAKRKSIEVEREESVASIDEGTPEQRVVIHEGDEKEEEEVEEEEEDEEEENKLSYDEDETPQERSSIHEDQQDRRRSIDVQRATQNSIDVERFKKKDSIDVQKHAKKDSIDVQKSEKRNSIDVEKQERRLSTDAENPEKAPISTEKSSKNKLSVTISTERVRKERYPLKHQIDPPVGTSISIAPTENSLLFGGLDLDHVHLSTLPSPSDDESTLKNEPRHSRDAEQIRTWNKRSSASNERRSSRSLENEKRTSKLSVNKQQMSITPDK